MPNGRLPIATHKGECQVLNDTEKSLGLTIFLRERERERKRERRNEEISFKAPTASIATACIAPVLTSPK